MMKHLLEDWACQLRGLVLSAEGANLLGGLSVANLVLSLFWSLRSKLLVGFSWPALRGSSTSALVSHQRGALGVDSPPRLREMRLESGLWCLCCPLRGAGGPGEALCSHPAQRRWRLALWAVLDAWAIRGHWPPDGPVRCWACWCCPFWARACTVVPSFFFLRMRRMFAVIKLTHGFYSYIYLWNNNVWNNK